MSNNSNNIYNILGKLEALKPTAQEKHDATVKAIYESVEAQGSIIEGVGAIQAKLAKQFAESVAEVAPPGAKAERMVKHIKQNYAKDGKLTDKEKAIAYATTWAAHNKGQVEEEYNREEDVKNIAQEYMQSAGITDVNDLSAEDIEYIGGEAQCNYESVCEILGCELPAELGPVKSYDEHGDLEEGCTCNEGACAMHEAEITRTAGKTVHRKTDFPGYPADDINDPDAEPTDRKRGRPRKHAAKAPTGLGRGRPVKAKAPTFSKQADPFGRVSGAVPKGEKGKVHTMAESMSRLERRLIEGINFANMMKETDQTIDELMSELQNDIKEYKATGHCSDKLKDFMQVHAHGKKQMADEMATAVPTAPKVPQGIPGNVPIPGKMDRLSGGRDYYEEEQEVTMEDELNELARLAGVTTSEGNAFTGKLKDTPKGGEFELDGKTFKDTSGLGEADLEEEDDMEEGNAFGKAVADAKADGVQPGEKVEVGGKTYPVKESTSFDGGESSDFNISTNMSSEGDKNVTVTATGEHAATLLQMLRIAGLGGGQAAQGIEAGMEEPSAEVVVIDEPEEVMDEEGVEVDHPAQEPANAPHEKYGTIKNITTQGDDMNREKSQDPATANKAANPMTNAQSVLKAVAQLESKLAEEYESIKKVSK